jgi:beta-lactam-binding protein with PASTA domain
MARPVPADFEDALASNRTARDRFWSMPPEQKDAWVGWIERARLPGSRRRRIGEAVRRLGGTAPAPRRAVAPEPAGVALPRDDWWVWLVGLALLAGLAAFLVWLTVYRNHDSSAAPAAVVVSQKATVPKVVGIRYQAAQFQLRQAKLASKLVRKPAKRPRGIVVGQAPKAGKSVPQGTAVALVISTGPPGVAMPDVTGLAAADAVRALQARGLQPTLQQVASSQPPGTVIAQKPDAGKRAKRGTAVTLQVAKGQTAIAVPDVTGQPQQQAISSLEQAGLKATIAQVPSSQAKGTVVAQSPSAGQKLARGSSVRLNVSKGQAQQPATTATTTQTTPPTTTQQQSTTTGAPASGNDYTGIRLAQAVQQIVQGRQQVIVQYVTSTKPAGVVVGNARAGSRERLQVSAGPHPQTAETVPDVTGEDTSTAQGDLQSAGFSVIVAQWPVSDSTSDGTVVYETPAAGAQAPQASAIVIYVGSSS